MGWLREENAYDRRMRELEEEAERVRKNMQALMKSTTRETTTPSATSSGPRTRSSAMPGHSYATVENTAYADQEVEGSDDEQETLSATDPRRGAYQQQEYNRTATTAKPERLANYLASGSFGKAGSLSRERKIQRNKAIFMLIVALLAIFSLISWFS
jgi:cobalamin biosynthesis Mg chelatase CobN